MWAMAWAASPVEDLLLNPTFHVLPRLQLDRSGFNSGDASFDLDGPRSLGTGISRAIKARKKFSGHFGASIEIEAQRIGKDGFSDLGHASNPTLGFTAQQALAAGGDSPSIK